VLAENDTALPVPEGAAAEAGVSEARIEPVQSTMKTATRTISASNAFLMTDMMKDVIRRGTATRALVLNRRDIAGKTGTTNDRRDAWFVGFNADLVGAAWVGFDQERPLGNNEEGGRTALPIWVYFMQEALRNTREHTLVQPEGIVSMRIAADTGKATTRTGAGTLFEYFSLDHLPATSDEDEPGEVTGNTSDSGNDGLF
jgi:penicillin-binding protein 1A